MKKIRVCVTTKDKRTEFFDPVQPHCRASLDAISTLPGVEIFEASGFFVQDNKNCAITRSQKRFQTEFAFDEIVFVDYDIGFTVDEFLKLVNSPCDAIGGAYDLRDNMPHEKGKICAGYMDEVKGAVFIERKTSVEKVDWVGSGFFKMTINALRKLEYPYYRGVLAQHEDRQVEYKDDIAICYLLKKAGFEIYIDHDIKLVHKVENINNSITHNFKRRIDMKKIEIINLFNSLVKITERKDLVKSREFSFAIAINKKNLSSIVDTIFENKIQLSDKYQEFHNKRLNLINRCAVKENNVVKTINQNGQESVTISDITTFNNEMPLLLTEYKEEIEKYNQQEKDYTEYLNKEYDSELKLYKISKTDLPEIIDDEIVSQLLPIIKETNE